MGYKQGGRERSAQRAKARILKIAHGPGHSMISVMHMPKVARPSWTPPIEGSRPRLRGGVANVVCLPLEHSTRGTAAVDELSPNVAI